MKRFVKFYTNYWVVFLIFVPLGVFVFGRSLQDAYGDSNKIKLLISDFLGINGLESYNVTWWFNQLIVYLYLMFPILCFMVKKWCIPMLLCSFVLLFVGFPQLPLPSTQHWLFVFVVGIVCAMKIEGINAFLNRYNKFLVLVSLVLICCILIGLRLYPIIPYFRGERIDGFLSVSIGFLSILIMRNIPYISVMFQYLGKHSMNIFMIHTFIFLYFFEKFIYSFHYSILIFSALLLSSLCVSILLEFLKKEIHLSSVIKRISQKIDNSKL